MRNAKAASLAVIGLTVLVAAAPARAATVFEQTNLVSDGFVPAQHTDPDLVNPWGVSYAPGGNPFWVSDNGTGVTTLYDGSGVKQGLVVTIPPPGGQPAPSAPTGQTFNSAGAGAFDNSFFLFATENGTIADWSFANGTNALTRVDNSASGAVFKGLALAGTGAAAKLYAADFHNGVVNAFNANFGGISAGFLDPNLPAGYAPFNVQNLGGNLYVTYAQQDGAGKDDVPGAGHGFVDVFNPDGVLVKQLIAGGVLNSPWGLAIAPSSFGPLAGALLVGNFGDGKINAFDPTTGALLGTLQDKNGNPLTIEGLWALIPGGGGNSGDPGKLYFSAGPGDEAHGLFGSLTAVPLPGTWSLLLAGLGMLVATVHSRRDTRQA